MRSLIVFPVMALLTVMLSFAVVGGVLKGQAQHRFELLAQARPFMSEITLVEYAGQEVPATRFPDLDVVEANALALEAYGRDIGALSWFVIAHDMRIEIYGLDPEFSEPVTADLNSHGWAVFAWKRLKASLLGRPFVVFGVHYDERYDFETDALILM